MADGNIDPRIIRTRKLIMESFIQLLEKKSFKKITIQDITSEAQINRATFYHHFVDKFELLENVTREELMENVLQELANNEEFNEEMLKNVFLSITKFLMSLSLRCQKSYYDLTVNIEALIKKELENIFNQVLSKQFPDESKEKKRITSTMLSWMIYGSAIDWQLHSNKSPEEYFELANASIKQIVMNDIEDNNISS